jgi:hypothetical protein
MTLMDVKVTVTIGNRSVPVEDVRDPRIATGVRSAGKDVGATLDRVKCPIHKKGPTNVRLHFDARGAADLKYDSCCEALGEAVGKALG